MNWKQLISEETLTSISEASFSKPILIFKHSTRCSISSMALSRLEKNWNLDLETYYLDLISYRSISNKIADFFNVEHQSPQVLLIKGGKCIFDASHMSIQVSSIENALNG